MGRRDKDQMGSAQMGNTDEADQAMAQLATEAAALTSTGKISSDIANKKNELLWNITAQIDETKANLEQLEETEKNLKKHLSQLQSLKKILSA